jgi:predicted RNase H-like nuclease (RuvC/YqgF family)
MRRAGKNQTRKTSGTTVILAVLVGLSLVLVVWREAAHSRAESRAQGRESRLGVELSQLEAVRESLLKQVTNLEQAKSELGLQLQSLRDRTSNLEAQRDHLQAESERQINMRREMKLSMDTLHDDLEAARQEALELSTRPTELERQLAKSRARANQLEDQLDQQAIHLANSPTSYEVEGLSSDEKVFALRGEPIAAHQLPQSIHLCTTGGLVLSGWIHRNEEEFLIGHVHDWHLPSSALVKGGKVFIVPRKTHESH